MDLRKVRKLIEIFHDSELDELEISEGEESIRLTRTKQPPTGPTLIQPVYAEAPTTPVEPPKKLPEATPTDDQLPSDLHAVRSPMVGTVYRASSPKDPPFVEVGDQVEVGQTLCLIEAMKIFNQIESDKSGTVVEILKDSGEPVEFGEVLVLIK